MNGLRCSPIVLAIAVSGCAEAPAQQGSVGFEPPAVVGTSVEIAGPREPGTRLIVTGRVVDSSGKPRAGIVIGVYHTDARGLYGRNTLAAPIARLHGWVKTDSLGRYEVRTIRPGAYPDGGTPAHIHFIVNDVNEELLFADPPAAKSGTIDWISPRDGNAQPGDTFALVRPVTRDGDGVEHVVRDFRVK